MSGHGVRFVWPTLAIAFVTLAACSTVPSSASNPQAKRMDLAARERVAAAAEASGDIELARSMYAAAAADAPANSEAQLRYATMLLQSGEIGPARELLERSLPTASDPLQIRSGLAMIEIVSGRSQQAIAQLDKVLAAQPRDLRALVNKAVALDINGQHDAAQQLYRRARDYSPNDPVISNDFALSLALQGRLSEAQAVLAPFKDGEHLPKRMQSTIRILAGAAGVPDGDPQPGDEDIKRMSLALAKRGS